VDALAAAQSVRDQLEELARHGVRTILMATLNEEVETYQSGDNQSGDTNTNPKSQSGDTIRI
jgi:hypothetical protein